MDERQRLLQREFRREQNREYNRQRNQALIKAGLCIQCKSPRDGKSKLRCASCHEKRRVYLKQWKGSSWEYRRKAYLKRTHQRRQEGRCVTCKNMLDNRSRSQCSQCSAKRRQKQHEKGLQKQRYRDGRGHCDNG